MEPLTLGALAALTVGAVFIAGRPAPAPDSKPEAPPEAPTAPELTVQQALEELAKRALEGIDSPTTTQRAAARAVVSFVATGVPVAVNGRLPLYGAPSRLRQAWADRFPTGGPFGITAAQIVGRQQVAIAQWYLAIIERDYSAFAATYFLFAPNVLARAVVRGETPTADVTIGLKMASAAAKDLDVPQPARVDGTAIRSAAGRIAAGSLTVGCGIAGTILGILTFGVAAAAVAGGCGAVIAGIQTADALGRGDLAGAADGIGSGVDRLTRLRDTLIQGSRTI